MIPITRLQSYKILRRRNIEETEMEMENSLRTNTDILVKWFPHLKGIESAKWFAYSLGTDEEPVPGPSIVRAYGLITLDKDWADEYFRNYVWETANIQIAESLPDAERYSKLNWNYSKDWENDVKPGYFNGKFYLSDNVLYFDVIR